MKLIALTFTLLTILTLHALNCDAQSFNFKHLSVKEGLSQATIKCMAQDSLGRIWLGTRDGLNCYDGSTISTYREGSRPNTIKGQVINCLLLEGDSLWVGTDKGLNLLNLKTLVFESLEVESGFQTITRYNNMFLGGSVRGLFIIDWPNRSHRRAFQFTKKTHAVNSICKLNDGSLLWGTKASHLEVNLLKYHPMMGKDIPISKEAINSIFQDKQGNIWYGTNGNGLFCVDQNFNTLLHFRSDNSQYPLTSNVVHYIMQDHRNKIWIATTNGITVYDPLVDKCTLCRNSLYDASSLSHDGVMCILQDQQNTIFAGTYYGGLNICNYEDNIFKTYTSSEKGQRGLSSKIISQIISIANKQIWIGTEGGGINILNTETGKIKHLKKRDGLSGNNIQALYYDGKDKVYAGTHQEGLNVVNIKTGKIEQLNIDNPKNHLFTISCIYPYGRFLLLGTHRGVFMLDTSNNQIVPFHPLKNLQVFRASVIFSITQDSYGNLWFGTTHEILRFNPKTHEFKRYNQSNQPVFKGKNNIYAIYEDHKLNLWFATYGSGLLKYDRKSDSFSALTENTHKLADNHVCAITESGYGGLWVSTTSGLSLYDYNTNQFTSFKKDYGFPLIELNRSALHITDSKEVFVGGIDGFVSFKEKDLYKVRKPYRLVFSNLSINNKPVLPGDETQILNNALAFTDEFELLPQHKTFTINYSASNYIDQFKCRYSIKLEGFHDDWVDIGKRNSSTFTNLNAGTYIFKVRAIDPAAHNKIVNEEQVKIVILAPLYKRWYAYTFYIVIIGLLILWFNRIYLSKARLANQLQYEKKSREADQSLTQYKLRFFTNVSHEFRTPLTLIEGFIDSVLEDEQLSTSVSRKLKIARKNSLRLGNLINELLDFRKIENEHLQLNVYSEDLAEFLTNTIGHFSGLARQKHVKIITTGTDKPIPLWFDNEQLEKVFYNLIYNAFKHIPQNKGKIEIAVDTSTEQEQVQIQVTDNGCGISTADQQKIFDRYYQSPDNSKRESSQHIGTGIGLALSKSIVEIHGGSIKVESIKGESTTFTVVLRTGNSHFPSDWLHEGSRVVVTDEVNNIAEDLEESEDQIQTIPLLSTSDVKHMLIVEDNQHVRQLLVELFQQSFKITEAKDGKEGLEAALKNHPDMIIADIMMPNMTGIEMCTQLKQHVNTSHIPIILLTAKTAIEDEITGSKVGADDYITKPFSTKLLKAKVIGMLNNRARIQSSFSNDLSVSMSSVTNSAIDERWMQKAEAVLSKNMSNESFDVNTFAKDLGMGRTNFYNKIKSITGQTPNEFIQTYRLKKAAELMRTDNQITIAEVSYAVGFTTPRYFTQSFKKQFGISPSQYRKQ
ncbi:response regulator [Puteibacter caeruleilacunae]|nr:response regulator [Puteibacter caeruleilacunae]